MRAVVDSPEGMKERGVVSSPLGNNELYVEIWTFP